jgi:hypothetical protein
MMTPEMKAKVAEVKKDPRNREAIKGKTDDEILAAYRFVDDGKGLDVYESEEAWREARRKKKQRKQVDEIEEV